MIAPPLGAALGATVVVENQPGAGGLTALNRLYMAAPDGLQLMIVNGTAASESQLLQEPQVQYDMAEFGYLGIVSASPMMWMAGAKAAVQTPGDARKPGTKIRWAASGYTDGMGDGASFVCVVLGLDCQVIRAYPGSNEAVHSVTQGETDAFYVSDTSGVNYVKSSGARAVAAIARQRSRFFADVPTIFETMQLSQDQQFWFDFKATLDDLGRILAAPPKLPPERLEFLQTAVAQVLSNPDFVAEGEKRQRYIDFTDGKVTRDKMLSAIRNVTPEQKKRVREILLWDQEAAH
jgi:tripartite-type tricarboxylate transporter receptor subunit TctC